MSRLETRFGLGTLLAALGGALVGAGLVLVRAGVALAELGWLARLFAPSGKEHIVEGATLVTVGLLLVLLSAARPRRRRR